MDCQPHCRGYRIRDVVDLIDDPADLADGGNRPARIGLNGFDLLAVEAGKQRMSLQVDGLHCIVHSGVFLVF